jgi:hypothetical protein
MPQTLDIRMARAAKAEARARRDPTQARHRSLLRARAALCALLRERSAPPDVDHASPAQLPAACIAGAIERSRPSAGPSSSFGVMVGQSLSTPTPIVASCPQHAT